VIAYNLSCARGHEFEGWFKDSTAYDQQECDGSLVCPLCGDSKIRKAIMAPSLAKGESKAAARVDQLALRQYATGLRNFIREHAEYVGPRFAEEARKIHYGEADERDIYGESTVSEVKELIDEGIEVAPIPADPDEMN
jgi:hypothetical protein